MKNCIQCGAEMTKERYGSNIFRQKFCGHACRLKAFRNPEAIAARFWAKVQKGEGCWIWQGARSVSKYGTFNWHGSNINAHRAAWMLTHGPIDPPALNVLHTCGNGIGGCVRPDHLYLGTDKENYLDRIKDGTASSVHSVELIREIKRRLADEPDVKGKVAKIARELNVHIGLVSRIKVGRAWRHVE
jgi:hypothetical protein